MRGCRALEAGPTRATRGPAPRPRLSSSRVMQGQHPAGPAPDRVGSTLTKEGRASYCACPTCRPAGPPRACPSCGNPGRACPNPYGPKSWVVQAPTRVNGSSTPNVTALTFMGLS